MRLSDRTSDVYVEAGLTMLVFGCRRRGERYIF